MIARVPTLHDVHRRLVGDYGAQTSWWPGRDDPFEVVIGAVLTQRASWTNAHRALERLRAAGALAATAIVATDAITLGTLIRPAGCFRAKAAALKAFCARLDEAFGLDMQQLLALETDELRAWLLSIRGIGDETADAILVYAAGRPSFVIDAYTRRLIGRLGIADANASYRSLQQRFMDDLPADAELFAEAHALIVRHGQTHCRPRPSCPGCPLEDVCTFERRTP